jgi:phosphoribosylaminoimidazole-succinocarboxamide synthase
VDTKYEFGYDYKDNLCLIDEIHTPDSSRYFYEDTYEDYMNRGETPKQLSKEFFRQWLIQNNFQGKEGQNLPEISDNVVMDVSKRYIELFDKITGSNFKPRNSKDIISDLKENIISAIS